MEVRLRYVHEAEGKYFTDCSHDELEDVIAFVKRAGGVYCGGGEQEFHSFQLCLDETGAYAEIIIGDDSA